MANPGYPMQHMPPMGPPPGGPMPPGPQVMRRGTSKAVPIVVSAGLAIGVFCGLLFGLGTGDDAAEAKGSNAPVVGTTKKPETDVPEPFQPTTNTPPPNTGSAQPTVATGSGSAAGSTAPNAGSGSATVAAARPIGKLKVEVTPEAAAQTAKIFVDGKQLDGNELEIEFDAAPADAKDLKKTVKVVVKASGYKDVEQKMAVLADKDNTLQVELVKRSSGGGNGLPRPPPPGGSGKKKKPPAGGGGLIDI